MKKTYFSINWVMTNVIWRRQTVTPAAERSTGNVSFWSEVLSFQGDLMN
jgi:hypothetical protein